jgi:hypothetical protein
MNRICINTICGPKSPEATRDKTPRFQFKVQISFLVVKNFALHICVMELYMYYKVRRYRDRATVTTRGSKTESKLQREKESTEL